MTISKKTQKKTQKNAKKRQKNDKKKQKITFFSFFEKKHLHSAEHVFLTERRLYFKINLKTAGSRYFLRKKKVNFFFNFFLLLKNPNGAQMGPILVKLCVHKCAHFVHIFYTLLHIFVHMYMDVFLTLILNVFEKTHLHSASFFTHLYIFV